jgi:hypothetical protein
MFQKLNLFPSSGEGWETPTLLGPLELTSITGQSLLLKCCALSCLLEYQMMEKVQKPSNPECYTPLSEPFRIYVFKTFNKYFICYQATFTAWVLRSLFFNTETEL